MVDQIPVLVRLRLREIERLDLGLEIRDLGILILNSICDDLVVECTIVRVLVVRDVTGSGGDGVLDGARVRAHVVTDLGDSCAVLAAAIGKLGLKRVGRLHLRDLSLRDRVLGLVPELAKAVGNIAELLEIGITQLRETLLDAVQLVHDALVVEAALNIPDRGTRAVTTTTGASVSENTASAPATEEGEEDD